MYKKFSVQYQTQQGLNISQRHKGKVNHQDCSGLFLKVNKKSQRSHIISNNCSMAFSPQNSMDENGISKQANETQRNLSIKQATKQSNQKYLTWNNFLQLLKFGKNSSSNPQIQAQSINTTRNSKMNISKEAAKTSINTPKNISIKQREQLQAQQFQLKKIEKINVHNENLMDKHQTNNLLKMIKDQLQQPNKTTLKQNQQPMQQAIKNPEQKEKPILRESQNQNYLIPNSKKNSINPSQKSMSVQPRSSNIYLQAKSLQHQKINDNVKIKQLKEISIKPNESEEQLMLKKTQQILCQYESIIKQLVKEKGQYIKEIKELKQQIKSNNKRKFNND